MDLLLGSIDQVLCDHKTHNIMQGPAKQYTKEMRRKFAYIATWNPGTPMTIGSIGVTKDGRFRRVSDLETLGIPYEIIKDNDPADLDYASEGSVTITMKASGSGPVGGLGTLDAGFSVEFKKSNSTLFKAKETYTDVMRDTHKLGQEILKRYRNGKWEKEWVVVTEVVRATSATILISNSQNGQVDLKATADGNLLRGLADPALELGIQFSRGMETQIIAEKGLTPLYRGVGIKTHLFGKPDLAGRGMRGLDMVTPTAARNELADIVYVGHRFDGIDQA